MMNPSRSPRKLDDGTGAPHKSGAEEAMLVKAQMVASDRARSAHVVVLGNEKGGSGKSTTAMAASLIISATGAPGLSGGNSPSICRCMFA
jgi:Mrp family chromosome partitioning ATPase